ncbi:hypothetical protein PV326_002209 [Microctonus aethiopoides]|nr:hypothetical protein PV326_002209 [Microctonus aethiopoides]
MYGSKVKAGLEEAYKKEDTQRIFEIISKTLLEEVRVSGKITLDDFSYLVNNSLKNEELREKVIEKFEQNLEFVDMITREENTTEKENLLEEKHYLLNQKAKHLKSLLNIAKNTPIFDVDVNKLHQDIETLDKDVKTLVEKAKDV